VEDVVDLPEFAESEAVSGPFRQMDVCLNTFKRTPLAHSAVPLKLFEYLSQCRPVVSTRIREVQRIDRDFLYYADTPDELVYRLETILNDYTHAIERTKPALDIIESRYNWDAIAKAFEAAVADQVRNWLFTSPSTSHTCRTTIFRSNQKLCFRMYSTS